VDSVPKAPSLSAAVLDRLAAGAENADRLSDWPEESMDAIRSAGILAGPVPKEYGGGGHNRAETLRGGELIASACLTTAFILAQQEAVVGLLQKSPAHLQDRYLRGVAAGKFYLSVGLSHLTTSRQDRGPYLRAAPIAGGGFTLDGEIPWVTGADRAGAMVGGATLPDGSQVVFIQPAGQTGVTTTPPLLLSSFNGSRTSHARYQCVTLSPEQIMMGPAQQVLGKSAGAGLETSGPAIGLATAATAYLRREGVNRPAIADHATHFETSLVAARQKLYALAMMEEPDPEAVPALRVESSRLALQATQVALLVAKGAGFVATHPTQRWARQALFFLVWSCTPEVVDELLAESLPKP
jgi:alkylation response protein AidB-like acyl-CoA dehydrogenase